MQQKKFHCLVQKVNKTLYKQQMLSPGDKILIGLSGGVDSYILAEILNNRKKHLPFNISLFAVHVKIKELNYEVDLEAMNNFCNKLQMPFYYIEYSMGSYENSKKSPCFFCSWHRRKEIFTLAKNIGCNKVAMGHHRDDAIETMLLNMIYHGSISSLPYKLSMFDGEIILIRPLLDLSKKEIIAFQTLSHYPLEKSFCQFKNLTKREEVKKILDHIRHLHPLADINLFRSVRKIFHDYLP